MDALPGFMREWLEVLQPYPYLQALLVILVFLVLAAVVDRLITGIVAGFVSRTETELDDRLLKILQTKVH